MDTQVLSMKKETERCMEELAGARKRKDQYEIDFYSDRVKTFKDLLIDLQDPENKDHFIDPIECQ